MNRRILFALVCCFLFLSCASTYQSRTIGDGNVGAELSLGGPLLTNLGAPTPLPNLYLGGRYGINDQIDVVANYNIFVAFMPQIPLDLNTSIIWMPIQPHLRGTDRGGFAGTALHIEWITDFSTAFHMIPRIDIYGGWRVKWFYPVAGTSLGLNFYRPHESDSPLLLSPYVGTDFRIRDHLGIMVRVTVYDVLYNFYASSVDWVYISMDETDQAYHGVWGISLGVSWDFIRSEGGKDE